MSDLDRRLNGLDQRRAAESGHAWGGPANPDPPLVCFPMPAPGSREQVRVEFPAPIVSSTQVTPEGVVRPKPIDDLATYAQAWGWDIMITYAHGWLPHATHGTPSAVSKESWGVRMRRDGHRAVAVRMGGEWASMWTWAASDQFVHHGTLKAFKEALA